MMTLDAVDLELMRLTQAGLPLVAQPYAWLGEQLSINSTQVMQRLQAMQDSGVIRRIAAVPNHYKLGYCFNGMSVWNIADAHIDSCGEQIGQLPFVSHCYQRPRHLPNWPYNLFAMLHAKSAAQVEAQVATIAKQLGSLNLGHEVLYSSAILKKTGFRSR